MDIVIGKNVIENLTTGMYENPKIIFREYIQNSADQIDKAVANRLLKQDEGYIDINLDYKSRTISIKDNATGISQNNFVKILSDIANSEKDRNTDKGFRGIGRLGGLAYCEKLIFKSTYFGENTASEMIWDGLKLKAILNDHTNKIEAAQLISDIISTNIYEADKNDHYFEVVLQNIYKENDELLQEKAIEQYLQEVAPVPYASAFYFKSEIKNFANEHNFKIDEYNIHLNGKEILKPYRIDLYEGDKNNKKIYDKIEDLKFEILEYEDIIYGWMWYGISKFEKQIPSINFMRGLRLRKENIQIGDSNTLGKNQFFKESRGNHYFIGEVFATSKDLIPNARRDYFNSNSACEKFENALSAITYEPLNKLYHYANDLKNALKKEIKNIDEINKITNDLKNGDVIDKEEHDKKILNLEENKKNIKTLHDEVEKIKNKLYNNDNDVFKRVARAIQKQYNYNDEGILQEYIEIDEIKKNKNYKTQELSKLNKREQKLVSKIYQIIQQNLPLEMATELINKIQEELKHG